MHRSILFLHVRELTPGPVRLLLLSLGRWSNHSIYTGSKHQNVDRFIDICFHKGRIITHSEARKQAPLSAEAAKLGEGELHDLLVEVVGAIPDQGTRIYELLNGRYGRPIEDERGYTRAYNPGRAPLPSDPHKAKVRLIKQRRFNELPMRS